MNNQIPNNPNIEVLKTKPSGLFTNYIYKAIPLAFDESMSYYETLCGLLNYLKNTIIPTVNNNAEAVEELQDLYVVLKTYVDNYFTDLNIQNEINNKLDIMASDGTLERIINEELFEDLNNKIDNNKIDLPNFFLSAFFETNCPYKIRLFTSLDDINYSLLNIPANLTGRDVSLQYNKINKKFYICLNARDNINNFRLLSSSDLKTWEETNYNVGIDPNLSLWAPDLYIDNEGKFYVVMSVQYGTEQDIAGLTIPAFDQYIATSNDGITFNNAYKINLNSDTRNYIDGSIKKINNIYYLIVKNEYYKRSEIFTTNDLLTFNSVNSNVTNSSMWLEGATLIETENDIYYIADAYLNEKYVVSKTPKNIFPQFNQKFEIINSLNGYRHGSSIYIDSFDAKKIISDLGTLNFTNNNILYKTNTLAYQQNYSLINNNNKDNLCIVPNTIYALTGGGETTVKIVNNFGLTKMKFIFLGNYTTKLKITHIDGVQLTKPIIITNTATLNEKVIDIPIQITSFETYTDFISDTINASNCTNINPDFQLTSLSATKNGNIVTMNFSLKCLSADYVNGLWVDSLFTLPTKWKSGMILLVNNDKQLNLQMYNTGVIGGYIKIPQNGTIFATVTYYAER